MKKESILLEIMTEAKDLIAKGYSVLPIQMPDKRPIGNWKIYQSQIISPQDFFQKLNKHNGDVGIALVTGAVSGNLEVIDVDEKHYHGISQKLLKELKEVYPDIYSRLRIEKTINYGVHIPYRISDGKAGRNRDVAKRYSTEDELKDRPDLKHKAFVEIKGEGGKITIPPTKGYDFYQENEIPTLTRLEADLIINLFSLFNEVQPEPKKPYKKTKSFRNYSTNPWEDFNSSDGAIGILEKHGWQIVKDNNTYTHFSKPNSRSKSVSASFIKSDRFYYVFTVNSNLEPNKGYSPASLLCELEFNGDTKECFKYLVDEGFGQFTEQFEEKLVKKSIISNRELPKNISKKSKESFEVLKKDHQQKYPYGIFWEGDIEDGFKINKELILHVASELGFKIYDANIVKIEYNEVSYPESRDFFSDLKEYIKVEEDNERIAVLDKFEDYVQKSGKYLMSRLPLLDESRILKDTRNVAYKPFLNGIVKITKSDVTLIDYEDNNKYYFSNEIMHNDFDFDKKEGGLFVDFLGKAILKNDHLKKYIGYYLHKYKDSSTSYYTVLTETVEDPRYGGGSGKNVFTNLLGHFTTSHEVPGSQIKFTSEFFQSWKNQRLMVVSDLPKNFDFQFFKNISSNSALIKKLYKDEYEVKPEKLPKLMFSTNYSFDITDGGLKRRTLILEFTDFFTKAGGVDAHYGGKLFPNDWTEDDWQGYYHYMVNCIKDYLNAPKLVSSEVSEGGWIKNFNLTHGKLTHEFIKENINSWLKKGNIEISEFNKVYSEFCVDNGIQLKYQKSSANMNAALEAFCEKHKIKFNKARVIKKANTGRPVRHKCFEGNPIELEIEEEEEYEDDLPF